MKNNQKTTNEGFAIIANKTLPASDILTNANNNKTANPQEWYDKMTSDAMLQVSAENTASRNATIDTWFNLITTTDSKRNTTALFDAFLTNPYYTEFNIRLNKARIGYFEMTSKDVRINFLTIDAAWAIKLKNIAETIAFDGRYSKMLELFMDNCIKNIAKDLSENAEKVIIPAINSLTEERKEYDFNGNSITALEKQLNAIVTAIMGNTAPKMLKADVKFLLAATTKANNNNRESEAKGHLTTLRERGFINAIFRAIEVRRNNVAYVIDSKASIHKAKKDTKKVAAEKSA